MVPLSGDCLLLKRQMFGNIYCSQTLKRFHPNKPQVRNLKAIVQKIVGKFDMFQHLQLQENASMQQIYSYMGTLDQHNSMMK